MKRCVLAIVVLLVALPLSADVIVDGFASTITPAGDRWVVGWANLNLPTVFRPGAAYLLYMANASINLNDGQYGANAAVVRACMISCFEGISATPGVSKIYWETWPMQGEVPVPITISYQDSVAYLSGEWTTTGSVFGYYTWWDGQGIRYEDFLDYAFRGPAEFDFLLSGTLADPRLDVLVTFSANAPSPIPEPATLLLLGTGLIGLCSRGLRQRLRRNHIWNF